MIFYCYISHNAEIQKHINLVTSNMKRLNYNHYKIFYGGENLNLTDNCALHVNCDDSYCGLPNKVHTIYNYLYSNGLLEQFSHICKIDCTTELKLLIPTLEFDYYGLISSVQDPPEYRKRYHFGRCKDHEWNKKLYVGKWVPYCPGGYTYILSKKSVEIIAKNPDVDDVYEDLYVGKVLNDNNIYPTYFNTRPYLTKW